MNIYKDSARLDKKDILVLIPPWRSPRLIYSVMKRHIPEEFGYLDYHYSPDLVNPDAYLTKKYFLEYVDSLVSELKDLKKKKSRNFYVYAESLGTSLALVLSSKIAVKKAILIAPGDNFAECFWKSVETRHVKEKMARRGMTLDALKKIWSIVSPDYYLNKRAGKTKYHLKLASNDTAIPFENGINLVKIMKRKKMDFEYDINNIPHITRKDSVPHRLTVWKECCLFPQGSLRFIIDKKKF